MKCPDVRKNLYAYLDGELDAAEAQALCAHLEHCPNCSQEEAAIARIYAATRSLPSMRLPADFATATVLRAMKQTNEFGFRDWWQNLTRVWRWAACTTALAGFLAGGALYQLRLNESDLIATQRETRFLVGDASLSDNYALAVWEGNRL